MNRTVVVSDFDFWIVFSRIRLSPESFGGNRHRRWGSPALCGVGKGMSAGASGLFGGIHDLDFQNPNRLACRNPESLSVLMMSTTCRALSFRPPLKTGNPFSMIMGTSSDSGEASIFPPCTSRRRRLPSCRPRLLLMALGTTKRPDLPSVMVMLMASTMRFHPPPGKPYFSSPSAMACSSSQRA